MNRRLHRWLVSAALGAALFAPFEGAAGTAAPRPPPALRVPRLAPWSNMVLKLQGVLEGGVPVNVTVLGYGRSTVMQKIGDRDYDGVKYPILLSVEMGAESPRLDGAFEITLYALECIGEPASSSPANAVLGTNNLLWLRPGQSVEVLKTATSHLTLSLAEAVPGAAAPKAVAAPANGGATFHFKGTLPAGVPLDTTLTTSGPIGTQPVELAGVELNGVKINLFGQVDVAFLRVDDGYLVNYRAIWNWPPAAGRTRTLKLEGFVFAKPGQPVTVLQANGANLTLTVSEPAENATNDGAQASSPAGQ